MEDHGFKTNQQDSVKTETKHDRFVRLAEKRVNNALKSIYLVGNLSNRNNYSYERREQLKIVNALKKAVAAVESRFDDSDSTKFKL